MNIYNILLSIQYIGIAVLIIEFVYVIRQKPSRLQILLLLVLTSTLANFAGYLFEMKALDIDMALTAVKIIYFGKPYIALGTFLFAMEFYRVHIPRWVNDILNVIHISVTIMVLTCEHHTLYYKSVDFTETGVFPHLVLGHSIIYIIYNYFLVSFYLLSIIFIGFRRYKNAVTDIDKKRIMLMISISTVALCGFLLFLSGISQGYDTTAPAYVISSTLLMIMMVKYDLFDALTLAKDDIIDELDSGVVVLDERDRTIYLNKKAVEIRNAGTRSGVLVDIGVLNVLYEKDEELCIGERIYKIQGTDIIRNQIFYGRIFTIGDITESYNHTIDLENQKAIAEQANRTKSDFLARMSHEIRTPINSVLGMNEMILRESEEPNIKKYAMNVKISATSLLGIINDILDTSKIESGKMEILPVEYEFDSLLNDVVNMINAKAKDKELQFNVNVDETLPNKMYGDDVRIRQVLLNLLTNAVKYTHEGSVSFTVSGRRTDTGILICYEVKDTGIGIKAEDMSRLFESFERIEESRNRSIEGTGLGMNIVVNLLKLMDTELKVDSTYGKGTTFYFELPQKIISDEPIGSFGDRVEKLGEEYHYTNLFTAPDAKILVVDDNEINRMVFTCMLSNTKIQITEAETGIEALRLVAKEHFDLIFLDHMMPELDGVETLHRMKAMENNLSKDAPVIILTANAITGAKEQYLSEGFDDYLSKPIMPEKLEQMIRDRLPREYVIDA